MDMATNAGVIQESLSLVEQARKDVLQELPIIIIWISITISRNSR